MKLAFIMNSVQAYTGNVTPSGGTLLLEYNLSKIYEIETNSSDSVRIK